MSAEIGFVRAIRDDPWDVTSRLVYADWLEDRDDPRGEFLRIQTELAGWVPDLDRRTALYRRQEQLLAQHEAEWMGPLQRHCKIRHWENGLLHAEMYGGWLSDLETDETREWLRTAWLGSLRLTGLHPGYSELGKFTAFCGIRAVDLSGAVGRPHVLVRLLSSLWLADVTHLTLMGSGIDANRVEALCQASALPSLKHLDLRYNNLDDDSIRTLLKERPFPQLTTLELFGNHCSEQLMQEMFERQQQANPRHDRIRNSFGMEFLRIPAGTFLMGSPETEVNRYKDEGPQHRVTITRPFYLGIYPVTRSQYAAVMERTPPSLIGFVHLPADSVSWHQAQDFCRRLSESLPEIRAGRCYRLPTEAEWEHACRGGTDTPFAHPYYRAVSSEHANYKGERPFDTAPRCLARGRTTAVGLFPPISFGLYDMLGNVWEWCQDRMRPYPCAPVTDPLQIGHADDPFVYRGGSWACAGRQLRSANRGCDQSHVQDRALGFRVVCELC